MKRKTNNPVAVAMQKRHPRSSKMTSQKRQQDYKNSWKKDAEDDIDSHKLEYDSTYNPALDPDYLWQLPED